MLKNLFAFLIFATYFGFRVGGINCIYATNGKIIDENLPCPSTDTLCSTVNVLYNDSGVLDLRKSRGCGNFIKWTINGHDEICTEAGNFFIDGPGYIGSVNCCDTDLCNTVATSGSTYYFSKKISISLIFTCICFVSFSGTHVLFNLF